MTCTYCLKRCSSDVCKECGERRKKAYTTKTGRAALLKQENAMLKSQISAIREVPQRKKDITLETPRKKEKLTVEKKQPVKKEMPAGLKAYHDRKRLEKQQVQEEDSDSDEYEL